MDSFSGLHREWLDAPDPDIFMLEWVGESSRTAFEVFKGPPDDGGSWDVWLSNAAGHPVNGDSGWAGTRIAKCATEQHARLVALALRNLRATIQDHIETY